MLYKKADGSVDEEVWEKEEEDDEEVVFLQITKKKMCFAKSIYLFFYKD